MSGGAIEESFLAALQGAYTPPPLPDRATAKTVQEAIADALAMAKSYDVADECVRFGMAPQAEGEEPNNGKARYIKGKLRGYSLDQLITLGHQVVVDYPTPELEHLLSLAGAGGVLGELKNLIFAAKGAKPEIVLSDAINNDIRITKNAENCLVYDRVLPPEGLTWRALVAWWAKSDVVPPDSEKDAATALYGRLLASMDGNEAEQFLFRQYCSLYGSHGFELPALIPQVYLHLDPYTKQKGGTLVRQRMDFLLLLPNRKRVVLELDGIQHYADKATGQAKPRIYAEMVAEDRRLRLSGYEVYRFGGSEFVDRSQVGRMLTGFFRELLQL